MVVPAPKGKSGSCSSSSPALRSVQRKVLVGPAGDHFEHEADRVANALEGDHAPTLQRLAPAVQRTCAACGGAGSEVVQRTCAQCEGEEQLQRKSEGSAGAEPALSARIDARRGAGAPLPGAARAHFEPRFGYDFGGVRIHTDGESAQLNRALGAAAFTIGRDIFFGAGRFQPQTSAGRRLLAHELTHTVQQGSASSLASGALQLQRLASPRVQTMDDATFERISGVGPALTATPPTMSPVTGVHGVTFTVNDCPDVNGVSGAVARMRQAEIATGRTSGAHDTAGTSLGRTAAALSCNIAFNFEKAHTGDYNYVGASGRTVRGAYTKVVMTPTGSCGACDSMPVLQVVRDTTGSGAAAPPTDPVRRRRSGWSATGPIAGEASPGWRVDTTSSGAHSTSPYVWTSNPGDATHPAISWDSPGDWSTATNAGLELRTCLLCQRAGQPSRPFACVDWGYRLDASGRVSFEPARPAPVCGAPTTVRDAVTRWNAIAGNTGVNLTP